MGPPSSRPAPPSDRHARGLLAVAWRAGQPGWRSRGGTHVGPSERPLTVSQMPVEIRPAPVRQAGLQRTVSWLGTRERESFINDSRSHCETRRLINR
ncbi:hypothetical protein GCM10010250_67480 [Streptomyces althioticus]|nr:hypothetical protein GCM10010250_67480 [Streptomyces althioticus]